MSYPRGIVFDIETIAHPDLTLWLGTEDKIKRLEGLDVEGLQAVAAHYDIALGSYKNLKPIYNKIRKCFQDEKGKAALKAYGAEICTVACRDVAGVLDDIEVYKAGAGDLDPEWPGKVWATDKEHTETQVIKAFLGWLESYGHNSIILLGFNIRGTKPGRKGFDIPMLRVRCAMLGIEWPLWLPSTLQQDRHHESLWDLCDVLHEGPCDTWLRTAGLPMKSAKGSEVANMTTEERRQYCANDVELERMLCGVVLPTQSSRLRELLYTKP